MTDRVNTRARPIDYGHAVHVAWTLFSIGELSADTFRQVVEAAIRHTGRGR